MSRDLGYVIPKIIELIPENETKLLNEIQKYNYDYLAYKSPELRNTKYCWIPFIKILNSNILKIEKDWQINIQKIMNNE
jgi:hypothetical protein